MSSLLCQLSYKPNAMLVGRLGFEPRFAGLKVRCIASYANNPLVERLGLEPRSAGVRVRYNTNYKNDPFKYGLGNGYLC